MSERQKYEPVVRREFKSTIPPHLLEKLPESERWIIDTMSRLEGRSDWLAEAVVQESKNTVDIGTRLDNSADWQRKAAQRLDDVEKITAGQSEKVEKLWDWKLMMSGKWGVLWAFLLVFVSVALKYLLDLWTKKGP